jgi:hypothetical protein
LDALFDDGEHGNGGMLDGTFAGLLSPGLPAGAEVQFYLEVTDLSEQTITLSMAPPASVSNTAGSGRRAARIARTGIRAEHVGVSVAPRR